MTRFRRAKQAAAYTGLTARVYQSGDRCRHGHISRQGSGWLRWILIEAALKFVRKDVPMANFYERIRKRSSVKIARVATARKLSEICWKRLVRWSKNSAPAPVAVVAADGGELKRTGRKRKRVVEDLRETSGSEVTEHTIDRDWCPHCKKQVEPTVPDAMPACTLGNRTVALIAWLHYGLGTTTSQVLAVFNHHLHTTLSDGGLTQIWHRLAGVLRPWADAIRDRCLDAGVLHADETGWRTNGETWWLWCFTTPDDTYYQLHPSRGHEALDEFFRREFDGILVSDFWKAYDKVITRRQVCWPHLLRDLTAVDDGREADDNWPDFSGKLRRIYADAVRLDLARDGVEADTFARRLDKLHGRVGALAHADWTNPHARRLAKRLDRYGEPLLTFVEYPDVPSSNNHAEREVRPAVLMRKASYGSQSTKGADTRATLMTVFRTLHRRGLDPLAAVEAALRTYNSTGTLPPLPEKTSSGG